MPYRYVREMSVANIYAKNKKKKSVISITTASTTTRGGLVGLVGWLVHLHQAVF
jgi:hypothetical protein